MDLVLWLSYLYYRPSTSQLFLFVGGTGKIASVRTKKSSVESVAL